MAGGVVKVSRSGSTTFGVGASAADAASESDNGPLIVQQRAPTNAPHPATVHGSESPASTATEAATATAAPPVSQTPSVAAPGSAKAQAALHRQGQSPSAANGAPLAAAEGALGLPPGATPGEPAAATEPTSAVKPIASFNPAASVEPGASVRPGASVKSSAVVRPSAAVKPGAAVEPSGAVEPAAPLALAAPFAPAADADTSAQDDASGLALSPRSPFGSGPSAAFAASDLSIASGPRASTAAGARAASPASLDHAVPELLGEAIDKTISQSETTSPIVLPPSESKTADEVAAAVAIAEHRAAAPAVPSQPHYKPLSKSYEPPPLSLFDFEEQKQLEIDRKAMLDLAQRLESTLADYLVKGRVTAIHPGPVVTMYEFVPAPGTKLSKITALSSDLAMALEALRVRIVAPIPGKAAVGIEVPNRARETVFLKEVLADEVFLQAKSKLTMALGKDIAGTPVCVDLAKMPHLLVAGTTGSGKSVSVNGMVCSLLCNASPDDVKMIMIDPKMLELSIYEGIPHLLLPVVTDPKKANLALRWAVEEMERRYELISKAGVRDIGGYNKKVDKQILDIEQEQLDMFGDRDYDISDRPRRLPYIVVLIDEFADLMMVAAKEVEISVARIAQKARAAGIHLILATQRPSVDVITGLIKANFPSRIAFQVASRIDSRTILDAQGAENLLGMGDMLFTDRGQALRRIHGPLITDTEVHRVVELL